MAPADCPFCLIGAGGADTDRCAPNSRPGYGPAPWQTVPEGTALPG